LRSPPPVSMALKLSGISSFCLAETLNNANFKINLKNTITQVLSRENENLKI
jgi:hypothetical protein